MDLEANYYKRHRVSVSVICCEKLKYQLYDNICSQDLVISYLFKSTSFCCVIEKYNISHRLLVM